MLIFRLLFIVGIIRLLMVTNKPFLCALIYAVLVAIASFVSGYRFELSEDRLELILVTSGVAFVASGIYFWLLKRFNNSFLWWPILIVGVLIVFL